MSSLPLPTMLAPQSLERDWAVLPSFMPVPDLGVLAVNSFVLRSHEPLLVDTGLAAIGDAWLDTLAATIDPGMLRWIWVSHADADHIGNLAAVLHRAPGATVLTSFLGMGKLTMAGFDPARMRVVAPGQVLDIGGRRLSPLRPPYYDAPETLGLFDADAQTLFAADCFGALLPSPCDAAGDAGEARLRDGLVNWSAIDAPWLAQIDARRFSAALDSVERLEPHALLCSHLPPIDGSFSRVTRIVRDAWCNNRADAVDGFDVNVVAAALATGH